MFEAANVPFKNLFIQLIEGKLMMKDTFERKNPSKYIKIGLIYENNSIDEKPS